MAHCSTDKLLPDFNSWLSDLDLSSPLLLENKIDTICEGIDDRLNPKNEIEYIKVMQSHLLLEVWSQIRIFINEQYQKNEYFSNAQITKLNHNKNKNNNPNQRYKRNKNNIKPTIKHTFTGSIAINTVKNNINIPRQSYLLLLWKNRNYFVNLSNDDRFNGENDDESKANDNNDNNKNVNKSSFPPHVLVQVATTKMSKKKNNNSYSTIWDIKLSLNSSTYNLIKENRIKYGGESDLNVIAIKNLIYLRRDYDAIKNIKSMPLNSYLMGKEYLIKQKCLNIDNLFNYIKNDGLINKYYNFELNKSQNIALKESLIKPLTLIHGPPGTGKTKYALLPILKCSYYALSLKYDEINRINIANIAHISNYHNLLQEINNIWRQARIGIFAGSNQAIDEIILSLLTNNNTIYRDIPIARMGNTYNMDLNIAQNQNININLWIDYYLNFKWNAETKQELYGYKHSIKGRINCIYIELKKIDCCLLDIFNSNTSHSILSDNGLWLNISKLINKSRPLQLELLCLYQILKIKYPNQAQRILLAILQNSCKCLFSTVNYLGRCTINESNKYRLESINKFDFSLFDECCQIRETETLIALQYCSRSVLIGDPKQLQATILYYGKYRNLLLNSLFIRIEKYIEPIMLNEQYRMNKEISLFPSQYFYNGKLLNSTNVENIDSDKNKLFHNDNSGHFKPYLFFDVIGIEEKRANSLINLSEIKCIENLINNFISNEKYLKEIKNIGIITPYLAHKNLIDLKLINIKKYLAEKYSICIQCVTIDEFQGSERDIIIFSCVRSNNINNIGFLNDNSRLNVAITRAKYALWIIGNSSCLKIDKTWNALLTNVIQRDLLISTDI